MCAAQSGAGRSSSSIMYNFVSDSPPESPSSTTSEDSECSANSSSSSVSPPQFVNKKPKFPTKYHEMLQPMYPVVTLPVNERSWRPELHHAGKVSVELQGELFDLLRGSSVSEVEAFLRQHSENVNVNYFEEEFGQTALHEACQLRRLDMARLLVQHGASAELANRDGFTVLHLAAFSGNPQLIRYLSTLQ